MKEKNPILKASKRMKSGKAVNDITSGRIIADARKKAGLNQRQLAALIKKEDGEPISQPYLNDIERDKRGLSSDHLINEFARVLKIDPELFYFTARKLPAYQIKHLDTKRVKAAYRAFERELYRGAAAA